MSMHTNKIQLNWNSFISNKNGQVKPFSEFSCLLDQFAPAVCLYED